MTRLVIWICDGCGRPAETDSLPADWRPLHLADLCPRCQDDPL